jgi:hypothetical protein
MAEEEDRKALVEKVMRGEADRFEIIEFLFGGEGKENFRNKRVACGTGMEDEEYFEESTEKNAQGIRYWFRGKLKK